MASKQTNKSQALKAPKGGDGQWSKKAAIAVQARKDAAKRREGKPASFRAGTGRLSQQ